MNIGKKTSKASLWFAIFFIGCISCKKAQTPTVETLEVTEITDNSAISGGKILDDGGSEIIEKGVCWKEGAEATIADNFSINSDDGYDFTSLITGLEDGTIFSVKAYAKNSEGIGYGKSISFTTYPMVPALSNVSISSVTTNSVVLEGYISWGKGLEVLNTGIVYSRTPNPDLSNSFWISEVVTDTIKAKLTGLESNTTYYVRLCIVVRLKGTTNYYAVMGNVASFNTKEPPIPLSVNTISINSIRMTTAEIIGEVIGDGGSSIVRRGICIGVNDSPTILDSVLLSQGGVGKFKITVSYLNPTTVYYVRTFVENDEKIEYGNQLAFTTCTGTIEDVSGNVYTTIKIGQQIWIQENLRVTKLNDGTDIPMVDKDQEWWSLKSPGYCFYNNITDTIYGALYNWHAVTTKKICPVGWHVPSDEEWRTLISIMGGAERTTTYYNFISQKYGFLASRSGYRSHSQYMDRDLSSNWWSINENYQSSYANTFLFTFLFQNISYMVKEDGASIRCLKDN